MKSFVRAYSAPLALSLALVALATGNTANADTLADDTGFNSFDHSLNVGAPRNTVPLVSINLGAATRTINSYSFDVTAVVNTWTVNNGYEPAFSSRKYDFSVQPGQRETFHLDKMKIRDGMSPQQLLDKMLIDGALTLNMVW